MVTGCIVDSALVDDTRVGVWIELYEEAFNVFKKKWSKLSFNYPLFKLQLGDQSATAPFHYDISYEGSTIEGIFADSTSGFYFGALGFHSIYKIGFLTQDVIDEGDVIHIDGQGYFMATEIQKHSFGDSFYYRDVKLELKPSETAETVLIDSYSETNYSSVFAIKYNHPSTVTDTLSAIGQTFQITKDYVVTSVKFYLQQFGTASELTGTCQILECVSGTDGTNAKPIGLAYVGESDTYDLTSVATGSNELVTFNFSGLNRPVINKNKTYCLQFVMKSGATATDYISVGSDNTPSDDGNLVGHQYGDWATSTSYDTIFYLYGYERPFQ